MILIICKLVAASRIAHYIPERVSFLLTDEDVTSLDPSFAVSSEDGKRMRCVLIIRDDIQGLNDVDWGVLMCYI